MNDEGFIVGVVDNQDVFKCVSDVVESEIVSLSMLTAHVEVCTC